MSLALRIRRLHVMESLFHHADLRRCVLYRECHSAPGSTPTRELARGPLEQMGVASVPGVLADAQDSARKSAQRLTT